MSPAALRLSGDPAAWNSENVRESDLGALCAAMGVPHVRAEPSEVAAHLGYPGVRVVEVAATRGGLRAAHAAFRARIMAALSGQ